MATEILDDVNAFDLLEYRVKQRHRFSDALGIYSVDKAEQESFDKLSKRRYVWVRLRFNWRVFFKLVYGRLEQMEQIDGSKAQVGATRVADADQTVVGNTDLLLLFE